MKYKVGDTVKYNYYKHTSVSCPSCGHEEIETTPEIHEGVITKASLEHLYGAEDLSAIIATETMPDGSIRQRPYLEDIKVIAPIPFYHVGNEGFSEANIVEPLK
jgi:hypothetical protein